MEKGRGAVMAKADIESAFRLLVAQRVGEDRVVHYLDDFLFIGKEDTGECQQALDTFQQVCRELGVPLARDKTEGPTNRLAFLGIEIDSFNGQCRLPIDKVQKLRLLLSQVLTQNKITLKQLQELVGLMNFACKVIPVGRSFMRRLAAKGSGCTKPHHRIRITQGMKEDLGVWWSFLSDYNGIAIWQEGDQLPPAQLFTDAAGGIGFGGYFQDHWFSMAWPSQLKNRVDISIADMEFFPVVVALEIWGAQMKNRVVWLRSDNNSVVHIVNNQLGGKGVLGRMMRYFTFKCLTFNVTVKAQHIPGIDNSLADALSRLQWPRFRSLAPRATPSPTPVPVQLWALWTDDNGC
ncbi:uncharacterized protein LOC122787541 [Protopterus annectens]|uniref:uncharacterized protein LOC122787541 n=1 Tax=Protopterus annectens TaxID=7888 RepID=UPI001CF98914|nr:uncharacterized protein LOC122787541 [Protopterus annectens]